LTALRPQSDEAVAATVSADQETDTTDGSRYPLTSLPITMLLCGAAAKQSLDASILWTTGTWV